MTFFDSQISRWAIEQVFTTDVLSDNTMKKSSYLANLQDSEKLQVH